MSCWQEDDEDFPYAPEVEIPAFWLEPENEGMIEDIRYLADQSAAQNGHRHHIPDLHEGLPPDYIDFQMDAEPLD